ncbi:MAG: DNA-processing protein DprA [Candidatus Moraniibacteriota bacterium]
MPSRTAILYALSLIPGIGSKTLRDMVAHLGSAEAVWEADEETLLSINGLGPKTVAALITGKRTIDPNKEWESITKQGVEVLAFTDETYPHLLKEIPDAPALLYVRGNYAWQDKPLIAIVGSRKFTAYGEQAAHRFATDLAAAGYIVVSGLAFGIDSIAHKAALEAGSETLAVLGSGIDDPCITPQSHLPLAKAVMRSGALISEYPPGTKATEGTFPARNRIMAGMSLGTLVIEAADRSGTLITARLALDYNREVFAVPGSIFAPSSLGTNALIRAGAKIVTSVQDILEEFPLPERTPASAAATARADNATLSQEEKRILALLSHEPVHVDKIVKASTLGTSSASSALSLLEIKGFARNIGGMNYIKM